MELMGWLQVIVQWLHVLLGIIWFGSVLYGALILIPAVSPMPLPRQRDIGSAIGVQAEKVIKPVAIGVIVLGILRGTVWGPINELGDLGTAYGITWLIALAVTIGAYLWGTRVVVAAFDQLNAVPEAEAIGSDGQPSPALTAAVERVKRVSVLELGFFFVILTCMILMRFGL